MQAEGLRITEVAFSASLHALAKASLYRFSAVVVPSTGPEYELRALVELPMRLTSKASYSTETQTLTVSGKLLAENKPLSGACGSVSSAPGGCKSESLDSIQNNDIKVARRGRVRA